MTNTILLFAVLTTCSYAFEAKIGGVYPPIRSTSFSPRQVQVTHVSDLIYAIWTFSDNLTIKMIQARPHTYILRASPGQSLLDFLNTRIVFSVIPALIPTAYMHFISKKSEIKLEDLQRDIGNLKNGTEVQFSAGTRFHQDSARK